MESLITGRTCGKHLRFLKIENEKNNDGAADRTSRQHMHQHNQGKYQGDDLFRGMEKFGDFAASPEKIKTNILTDRLKWLEENEIIQRKLYQVKPTRYQYILTEKGRDLRPILWAIALWGETHIEGTFKVTDKMLGTSAGIRK